MHDWPGDGSSAAAALNPVTNLISSFGIMAKPNLSRLKRLKFTNTFLAFSLTVTFLQQVTPSLSGGLFRHTPGPGRPSVTAHNPRVALTAPQPQHGEEARSPPRPAPTTGRRGRRPRRGHDRGRGGCGWDGNPAAQRDRRDRWRQIKTNGLKGATRSCGAGRSKQRGGPDDCRSR